MKKHNRRDFLASATAAGAAWLSGYAIPARSAQTSDSHIEVLLNEPVATIAPEIYGHFVEHLGGVVYDGIWVGERSSIPNQGGLRKQLIDSLRRIKPSVIRWPGGCFADQYDWRDGVGPREKRPKRTNFWADAPEWPKNAQRNGPQFYDPNQFGTVEFARFCKLTGAQPYFAANLRSLPAQSFWRWVEYCNSSPGSTTLADERAADGERDPLNVRFWGVGNESWGCGGEFTPEDYASEFRRYTAWTPGYAKPLSFVGSGPNDGNVEWTRRFFGKVSQSGAMSKLWGWAMHHYAWNSSGGRTNDWQAGKGDALKFDSAQYYEILHQANEMDTLINAHWSVMAESDPKHRVKLVVDEWGAWYAPGTEPFAEALIGQQSTMRDAVLAGLTLATFNRHADKVAMAAVAQLINCLQSPFLAHEDKFCLTPTYHVFDMYSAHQGATSLRTLFSAPSVSFRRERESASLPGLAGSASVNGKTLTLTVTNPSIEQMRGAEVRVRGGAIASVKALILSAADVHEHNSFERPNAVGPKQAKVNATESSLQFQFAPASVTKFEIVLS